MGPSLRGESDKKSLYDKDNTHTKTDDGEKPKNVEKELILDWVNDVLAPW